jgi:hypothetical protein
VTRNPEHGTLLISVEVPVEEGELIVRALESVVASGEVALGADYVGAYGRDRAGTDRERAVDGWRAQQADALVALAKAQLSGEGVRGVATSARASAPSGSESSAPSTGEASLGTESSVPSRGESPVPSKTESAAGSGTESHAYSTMKSSGHSMMESSASRPRAPGVADHYQVIVHVDEKALHGGMGGSDLPIETVRRLTCEGSLIPLVEDEHGTPRAIGRKHRVVSTTQRRVLWSRDRGCTFPGCSRTRYVEAHHIRHWADGGETVPGNLTLCCSFHHRLLHEGGFRIRRGRDGRLEFLRPDGRVIPRSGYRPEDWTDEDGAEGGCDAAGATMVAAAAPAHDCPAHSPGPQH